MQEGGLQKKAPTVEIVCFVSAAKQRECGEVTGPSGLAREPNVTRRSAAVVPKEASDRAAHTRFKI